jgi:hypothetical protein
MSARSGASVLFAAALWLSGCASKPAPPPPAPPPSDETESLVESLARFFSLDRAQQEKTRQFARELADRNREIRAGWERGEKMRPEVLLASQAKFDAEFTAILTPEQRNRYDREWRRLMLKGRSVQPGS